MACGAQATKMVAMLAILLIATMADSHPQPERTCSSSVECACAERCVREYPSVDGDPPFKISPVCTHRTEHELYARLYTHHAYLGHHMSRPQGMRLTEFKNGFGSMTVNDWLVTDGPSRDTKVVARAKGVHIQAGMDTHSYYVSFNMVFEEGRFKGSTLQVMGTVVEKGEWAIVGGTGELTLARGVIYKHDSEFVRDEGDCIELDIHCLYTPMERSKGTSWTFEA
ncbi:dirigent protein 11-like [Lolium rigidum]|uniref:dirigent protein 11-like n=1 Tax=Lolium rigidum TaxID=89674 RepID=UPI001F5D451B|nr:dirigent protein 11-like [Lolium rigidum]